MLMTYDVDKGYLLFLGLHVTKNKENSWEFITSMWKTQLVDVKQIV